jgi:hypothetical protein
MKDTTPQRIKSIVWTYERPFARLLKTCEEVPTPRVVWHSAREEESPEILQKKSVIIEKATKKFKRIFPCSKKTNLHECFTIEAGELILWFNTDDFSTHCLSEKQALLIEDL